jgi:septal ring factor EnvC (AmiA/AmiB activator)
MKKIILSLLLLSACHHSVSDPTVAVNARKQRQKIALLKKKLGQVEEEQRKAKEEAEKIAAEINEAELALIRRQVDQYEKKSHNTPMLFLEEREALYRMIQSGHPGSLEAQLELDRILRLITASSDS